LQAEAQEIGRQGGSASFDNPAPAADPDAAAEEAPEDPGASDSVASFRSMIESADTIEHVVGLDVAFAKLRNTERELQKADEDQDDDLS